MEIRRVKALVKEYYRIAPDEVIQLGGYDNLNFKIRSKGINFVFKVYPYDKEKEDQLLQQNRVLGYLSKHKKDSYPIVIPSAKKSLLHVTNNGQSMFRLLNFLEGEFIGSLQASELLFSTLGSFLAELNLFLKYKVEHSYKPVPYAWDLQFFLLNEELINYVENKEKRAWLEKIFQQYKEQVSPNIPKLRKSLIHGDANEWNTLARQNKVSAIIDFDDMNYGPLINDLAICICYAILGRETPLKWAKIIIKSYHQVLPLEEIEVQLLFHLIAARLCTSVCHSAKGRKENPENLHQFVSESNAWDLIKDWVKIDPNLFFSEMIEAISSN